MGEVQVLQSFKRLFPETSIQVFPLVVGILLGDVLFWFLNINCRDILLGDTTEGYCVKGKKLVSAACENNRIFFFIRRSIDQNAGNLYEKWKL